MANVRPLNQDDVLGADDELSPSSFPPELETDEDDGKTTTTKKSSGMLPMIGGIASALAIVGIFGWKMVAPHLKLGQQSEAFEPIPSNASLQSPSTQQAQPEAVVAPNTAPPGVKPVALMQDDPALVQAPPAPLPQGMVIGQPQLVAAQPSQPTVAPQTPAPAAAQPAQFVAPATAPVAAALSQQAPVSGEDLTRVNRRIDGLERSLAALQESVNKLSATVGNLTSKTATVAVKPAPAPTENSVAKVVAKPAPLKPKKDPVVITERADTHGDKPAASIDHSQKPTLKAVLDGRAWFQTKNGESITATPGESVPGVGVVKSIDTDRGEVRFANGVVIR